MRIRDWVSPKILCQKHLNGEHVETHFLDSMVKSNKSCKGYIEQFAISKYSFLRHHALVVEMERRGYNHNSPKSARPSEFHKYAKDHNLPAPDPQQNVKMLIQGYITKNGVYKKGCRNCQERYIKLISGREEQL